MVWEERRLWVQMAWGHALALPVVDPESEQVGAPRAFISSYSKLR